MREIKFRAWDNRRKQMNYKVCVGNTDMNDENYTCSTILIDGEWVHFDDYCDIVVEQYTGLKDKNGFEIYEGDIVHLPQHNHSGRVFLNVNHGWVVEGICMSVKVHNYKNIEVIGNIHDNPELMEEKK